MMVLRLLGEDLAAALWTLSFIWFAVMVLELFKFHELVLDRAAFNDTL